MKRRGEPDEGLEETVQAPSAQCTDPIAATTPASGPGTAAPLADTLRGIVPAQPERIGRYTIRGILGRGGMGVVYIGYDAELEREVAIKLVRAEAAGGSDGPTRLKREARIMAQLSHPNLVAVHEVGEHEGQVYVAMELVKGLTLRKWLRKQDRTWREIMEVYLAAAHGLAAAHKVGVIHRDFKPDNVIVAYDGRVRVLDFGLARPVGAPPTAATPTTDADAPASLTLTGTVMGTPAYMPPEQHEGKLTDARADQFSYCVSLFEALYGGRPFVGSTILELAKATTSGEVAARPPDTKVPRKVHDALLRGLQRDPNDRFNSMDDLSTELARRSRSRGNKLVIAGAGVAATAIVLSLFLLRSGGAAPPVDETCKPIATQLTTLWDPDGQRRLEARFTALKTPYAGDVWTALKRDFNAYIDAWSDAQRKICDRTGKRDRLLRAQQLTCLDDHLLRMRAYISATAEVDINALALSFEGLSVTTAMECTDVNVVRARAMAPHGDTADAVTEQRSRVYKAHVHISTHRFVKWSTLTPHLVTMRDASENLKKIGHGPAEAEALFYLGRALGYVNKTAQAKKVLTRALEIAETNRADTLVAAILIRLVHMQAFAEGAKKADIAATLKRAEIALKRAGGPAMLRGQLLHTRAHVANLAHKYAVAVRLAKAGHTAFSLALPPRSHRLALIESDLAAFADRRGQADVRLAHLSVALDSFEHFLGPNHPRLGHVLSRLADAHARENKSRRGLGYARRAIRLLRQAVDQSSPWIGAALYATSRFLHQYGRESEARAASLQVVKVLARVFPRSGYAYVRALTNLGDFAWNNALDIGDAQRHLSLAVSRMKRVYPARNGATMRAEVLLAEIRLGQGRYSEAARLATATIQTKPTESSSDWPRVYKLRAVGLLARIAAAQKNPARANAHLRRLSTLPKQPIETAHEHMVRGHVSLALNRLAQAIKSFSAALATKQLGRRRAAIARGYLAIARARAGMYTKALPELNAAIDRDPGKGHPLGIIARFELAKIMWYRGRDRQKAKSYAKKARRALKRYSPRKNRATKAIDRWLKLR